MTKLLISVRDAAEAATALEAGAEVIDVKEPARGSLGRADRTTIESIVDIVGRRRPVSAALGELMDWDEADRLEIVTRLDFVKFGLSGCAGWGDWISRWREAVAALTARTAAVAVVYADFQRAAAPDPSAILDAALTIGCGAILVDTFDKSAGSLLELWTLDELNRFARAVRNHKMLLALAGSLTLSAIRRLLPLEPDYIAVRGAVCDNGRNGPINGQRIRELAATFRPVESPCPRG